MQRDSEKKEMLLRFQYGILDFENDRHEVLRDESFVNQLIDYLFRLQQHDHLLIICRVVDKLGDYVSCGENCAKERSLYVLAEFIDRLSLDECSGIPDTLSRLFDSFLSNNLPGFSWEK